MLSTEESSTTNGSEVNENKETVEVIETCPESNGDVPAEDKSSSNTEETQLKFDGDEWIREGEVLLKEGKHLLKVKDYSYAASVLLSACCKFCQVYGALGNECGDAYFHYGCALLESTMSCKRLLHISRKENSSVKSDVSVEESVNGSESDQPKNNSSNGTVQSENGTSEQETMVPVDKIGDGQLAREMFELAKDIYIRQNNVEILMDIYSKLTSADLFLGNYASAIVNGKKCLALHEEQLVPVERDVADILLKLGTACVLSKEYYTAVKHFTSAGVVYEKLIRRLLRSSESYKDADDSELKLDEIYSEVDEIKSLLKSTKDKICETEELIRESMRTEAANGGGSKANKNNDKSPSNGVLSISSDSATRANIITNLLRRKRKLIVNNGNEIKKPRLDVA